MVQHCFDGQIIKWSNLDYIKASLGSFGVKNNIVTRVNSDESYLFEGPLLTKPGVRGGGPLSPTRFNYY